MAISDIKERDAAYYVFDSAGNQSETVPTQLSSLPGICPDFIILERGGMYYTFDEKGKQIGTVPRRWEISKILQETLLILLEMVMYIVLIKKANR